MSMSITGLRGDNSAAIPNWTKGGRGRLGFDTQMHLLGIQKKIRRLKKMIVDYLVKNILMLVGNVIVVFLVS